MLAEVRVARIVEAIGRWRSGALSCREAAEVLGMSERHFRRLRDRYEADGAEGLIDRRRGRVSGRRVPVDRIEWLLEQFRTRYFDFTVKHFHEQLVAEHNFALGYTGTKRVLQDAGLVRGHRSARRTARSGRAGRCPACCCSRTARPTLARPGGRRSTWSSRSTMRRARSTRPSWSRRKGRPRAFAGSPRRSAARPVLRALYRPRQPLFPDAEGRRQGRQGAADPGRARPGAARHRPHPVLFARGARPHGAGVRHVAERLPPELRLAGITTVEAANRYLDEQFVPDYNARFAVAAAEAGTAFIPYARDLADILCMQESAWSATTTACATKGRLQIPPQRHRHHYVKVTVRVHEYADGRLAIFDGPRCLARYQPDGSLSESRGDPGRLTPLGGRPGGLVDNAPRCPQPHRANSSSGHLMCYETRTSSR